MLRYRLRTLLILLAILPPLLWVGWTKYAAWRAELARRDALRQIKGIGDEGSPGSGQQQETTPAPLDHP